MPASPKLAAPVTVSSGLFTSVMDSCSLSIDAPLALISKYPPSSFRSRILLPGEPSSMTVSCALLPEPMTAVPRTVSVLCRVVAAATLVAPVMDTAPFKCAAPDTLAVPANDSAPEPSMYALVDAACLTMIALPALAKPTTTLPAWPLVPTPSVVVAPNTALPVPTTSLATSRVLLRVTAPPMSAVVPMIALAAADTAPAELTLNTGVPLLSPTKLPAPSSSVASPPSARVSCVPLAAPIVVAPDAVSVPVIKTLPLLDASVTVMRVWLPPSAWSTLNSAPLTSTLTIASPLPATASFSSRREADVPPRSAVPIAEKPPASAYVTSEPPTDSDDVPAAGKVNETSSPARLNCAPVPEEPSWTSPSRLDAPVVFSVEDSTVLPLCTVKPVLAVTEPDAVMPEAMLSEPVRDSSKTLAAPDTVKTDPAFGSDSAALFTAPPAPSTSFAPLVARLVAPADDIVPVLATDVAVVFCRVVSPVTSRPPADTVI